MNNWFGVLMSVMLLHPRLYPGYLMLEDTRNLGTLKIGASAGWILLFITIPVLVLVYILLWRSARSHKRTDH
jgi:hypothetical protein